jgi:hypothetical protein
MTIYLDENLPPQLAEGLDKLQEPLNKRNGTSYSIKSVKFVFGQGVKDEEWIPIAGKERAIAITRDFRIQTTRHQKELCKSFGLRVFFFAEPSQGTPYWQIVKTLIDKWESILKEIEKNEKPFALRFTMRSSRFDTLS